MNASTPSGGIPNGGFTALEDDAIHAFTPAPARRPGAGTAAAARPARRRVWPWLLAGLVLMGGLLLAGALVVLDNLVSPWPGEAWPLAQHDVEVTGPVGALWLLVGLLVGGLVAVLATVLSVAAVLLLVPLGLALGLLGAALSVGATLLGAVALVAALLLPLWLPLLLLWLLLRPRRPASTTAARMPA